MKRLVVIALASLFTVLALRCIARARAAHFMIFAGDSIMLGIGSTSAANTVVGRLVSLKPHWYIRNYSFEGAAVSGGGDYSMDPSAVVKLHGDTIVVLLGTNDWNNGIAESIFKTDYSNFITSLEVLRPTIVCVTPIWRADEGTRNKAGNTIAQLRSDIASICSGRGHSVIDGLSLVPSKGSYYTPGGIHPNDDGYACYANNLAAALSPYLR
jgi:lysophospholipase L1-like esterase